jgi:hypothetical protein
MDHVLDNPVWHALTGPHAAFAIGSGRARHYPRDIVPFSAIAEPTPAAYRDLAVDLPPNTEARLHRLCDESVPSGWDKIAAYPMLQMVADRIEGAVPDATASVAYMQDVAKSYTDTYGIVIPDVKSRLGQAKAGPDISYRYQLNRDLLIEPHAGVQVIWNFANDTTAAGFGQINGDPAGPAGVRGRAEVGLRASTSMGISLDLSGSYDGIGAKDYDAFTGKATLRVPLN